MYWNNNKPIIGSMYDVSPKTWSSMLADFFFYTVRELKVLMT
jgi:hypothetical protein